MLLFIAHSRYIHHRSFITHPKRNVVSTYTLYTIETLVFLLCVSNVQEYHHPITLGFIPNVPINPIERTNVPREELGHARSDVPS